MYHSSVISGIETIVATAPTFPEAPAKIRVGIDGLLELPEAPDKYVLVGTPENHIQTNDPCRPMPPLSRHFKNHFGKEELIAAVRHIAEEMHKQTDILLRVNDMALSSGGLFDISNNWRPEHFGHRVGLAVDIPFRGVQGRVCQPYDLGLLRLVIRAAMGGNSPVVEGDHYHAFLR